VQIRTYTEAYLSRPGVVSANDNGAVPATEILDSTEALTKLRLFTISSHELLFQQRQQRVVAYLSGERVSAQQIKPFDGKCHRN
jgi:hypothetical protein